MLKDINLDLDLITDNHYDHKPVGVIEDVANDLEVNELAYEIMVEAHKLTYTAETITAIENSIIASIESGKIIVTDIIDTVSNTINNINNEIIIDSTYGDLIIGKENSIYVEGVMDNIKRAAKAVWEKIKTIMRKIIDFFKKLINKITNKTSSGGGGGGSSSNESVIPESIVEESEVKSLNRLVELINEGDKDKLMNYIDRYYSGYKELLIKLMENNDIVNLNISTKGKKVNVNYIEINNFKAFKELKLEGVSKLAQKYFDSLVDSIEYINKNRNIKIFKLEGRNTYNLTAKSLISHIVNYNRQLDTIRGNLTVSKLINVEGKVTGINLNSLTLKDFTLTINELSKSIVTCIKEIRESKIVTKGMESYESRSDTKLLEYKPTSTKLLEYKPMNTKLLEYKPDTNISKHKLYAELFKHLPDCIETKMDKTILKNVNITGKETKDINITPTDSPFIYSKVKLNITEYLEVIKRKYYNGKSLSKIESIGIIGSLFNHLEVENIDEEKELLNNFKLLVNLSIDTSKDIKTQLENINNALSKANDSITKINELLTAIKSSLHEITIIAERINNEITKIDEDGVEYISKIASTITNKILEPLRNIEIAINTITDSYTYEKRKVPVIFNKYRSCISGVYRLALVKKALDVINEGK